MGQEDADGGEDSLRYQLCHLRQEGGKTTCTTGVQSKVTRVTATQLPGEDVCVWGGGDYNVNCNEQILSHYPPEIEKHDDLLPRQQIGMLLMYLIGVAADSSMKVLTNNKK